VCSKEESCEENLLNYPSLTLMQKEFIRILMKDVGMWCVH